MKEKLENLINNKKYVKIKQLINSMNEHDVAEIIEELPEDELVKIFRLFPKDMAADVFTYLDPDIQKQLITLLTNQEVVHIITNMYADDATDLLEEMPASVVTKILSQIDKDKRRDINLLLNYPENSAGSIMTVELIDLKENITVKQALEKIRKDGLDKESIDNCYVVDNKRKLIGIVTLKEIILNEFDVRINDIMDDNVISVNTHLDQEEVSKIFQDYDITSAPVTDSENRLVGIITIDDIMDIVTQEATEDMEMMAGMVPTEKPYLKLTVWDIWKSRIPWLLLLMISATFTGKIIQHYEDSLAAYVILTSFIPMLMNTGGNAGGQSSVTIIRGLSINEIEFKNTLNIMWKEFKVGILVGITLSFTNFLKLLYFDQIGLILSFVVSITLLCTVIIAKIVGCTLPILAKKLGFDPAVMASPFITTILDAVSLLIFFQFATSILHI